MTERQLLFSVTQVEDVELLKVEVFHAGRWQRENDRGDGN